MSTLADAMLAWKAKLTTKVTPEQVLTLRSDVNVFVDDVRFLESENDELRELIRDMWQFTGVACKKYPRLFDPVAAGGQTVQLNAIDAFEQRMHELGIEAG